MFFYQPFTAANWIMVVVFVIVVFFANEATRRSKWCAMAVFIVLPIFLTLFVWTHTAPRTISEDWFLWVKVYSAVLGVIGAMAIRFIKRVEESKFIYIFPPAILAINILQAVYREFEIFIRYSGITAINNDLTITVGPWNLLNAIAGILTIVTITGWSGIQVAKTKHRDIVWSDMTWLYIIAYSLWNFAYVYNALPDRSLYSGLLILTTAAIANIFQKGSWLQHRGHILAMFAMFNLTFPAFAINSQFSVTASESVIPNYTISILSLAANVALCVYMIYCMKKHNIKNPYTNEVFGHLYTNVSPKM